MSMVPVSACGMSSCVWAKRGDQVEKTGQCSWEGRTRGRGSSNDVGLKQSTKLLHAYEARFVLVQRVCPLHASVP